VPQIQQFPNLGAPVVTANGLLTQEWRQFFQTMWARTGSAIGGLDIKVGTLLAYAGATAPDGYLLCQGQEVSRALYPVLFATVGLAFGTPSSGLVFKLPDCQGRALIGSSLDFALGSFGGAASLALTLAELPTHSHGTSEEPHTHGFTESPHTHTITDPGHTHTARVAGTDSTAGAASGSAAGDTGSSTTGITVNTASTGGTIDAATTGLGIESAGQGEAFSVQNPYLAVNWIIKT
jgi:microcystin-dependent protein